MTDRLATADPRENFFLFRMPLQRDNAHDRLADHLRGRILEQPARALVPACYDPRQRNADDRVVAIFDDCRQAAIQRFFGLQGQWRGLRRILLHCSRPVELLPLRSSDAAP